ncbi:MAG TPA: protein kinase [Polyangiaceae bacterium]|nr:protein kinase [Polyangiaceae bacterium]
MTDNAFAPGKLLAGKFRVVRLLGEGGMGAVYEIEHELTKHRRALKTLHAAMASSPSIVERFLREASAAGRVGNPHIVETFDAGVLDSGEPYLVMEILRGEPLSNRIARGPMLIPEVVDLMGQACVGVAAAHAASIVHRDLKPDNLFIITGADGRPFVKILDFGISKFDTTQTGGMQLTKEGSAMGTPYYMSPEQIRGVGNLDARADVYALGVILYECVTAKRPFESEVLTHLAVLIHAGQTEPIEQLRPDLPPGFADLVRFAMASDRERRMQSATELRTALERYGAVSDGVPFRPPTMPSASTVQSPPSAVQARSLAATSGVGVSMRNPTPTPKKSHTGLIVSVAGLGLATLAGGYLLLRAGSDAAAPATAASSSETAASVTAEPTAKPEAAPVPSVAAPPAIASEKAAPAPVASGPTAVGTDISPTPAGPRPAVLSPAAPAPAAAPAKPTRAEEKGLAKDNPFK